MAHACQAVTDDNVLSLTSPHPRLFKTLRSRQPRLGLAQWWDYCWLIITAISELQGTLGPLSALRSQEALGNNRLQFKTRKLAGHDTLAQRAQRETIADATGCQPVSGRGALDRPLPGESGLVPCGQYDRADVGDFQGEVIMMLQIALRRGSGCENSEAAQWTGPVLWGGEPGQQRPAPARQPVSAPGVACPASARHSDGAATVTAAGSLEGASEQSHQAAPDSPTEAAGGDGAELQCDVLR